MLKIEYFYYIIEIYKTGSINKAAEHLFLSQPYLSLVLKKMEEQLDVKLFIRSNSGVSLTDAGKDFLKISKDIVKLVDKANHIKENYTDLESTLNIVSMPSFAMLDLISHFKKHKDIETELEYSELPNDQVLQEIQSSKCNVGLYYLDSREYSITKNELRKTGINFTPLVNEPLCAVVSKTNPLYEKEKIKLSDLEGYNFLAESIKITGNKMPIENNPFPEIFKVSKGSPKFNNNRSLLYYLTKTDKYYCIGQRSLNITNPFFEMGLLKYIPITDLDVSFIVGYLTADENLSSTLEESFITFIDDYFYKYNINPENKNYIINLDNDMN